MKPPKNPVLRDERKRQIVAEPESSDEESEEENARMYPRAGWGQARPKAAAIQREESSDDSIVSLEVRKQWIHFCCKACSCVDRDFFEEEELYFQTTRDHYYHRRCCHGLKDPITYNSSVPLDQTLDGQMSEIIERKIPMPEEPKPEIIKKKALHKLYLNSKTQESKFYNELGNVDPAFLAQSNEAYTKNLKEFALIPPTKRPAVVLDLFAGIGTGIVVLKRLGVSLSKVIHVEHDKVATHVFRSNHDPSYGENNSHNNKTSYVLYDRFEDIEEDVDLFMEEHGPIDILIAGPPGSDSSMVNSNKKGNNAESRSYMLRIGELVQSIRRHSNQRNVHLMYVVENVRILRQKDVPLEDTDVEQIKHAFGQTWEPVDLDAAYLSPGYRLRRFFTNIPLAKLNVEGPKSQPDPHCCLDKTTGKEFLFPYRQIDPQMTAKVGTFTASYGKLDSDRVAVFAQIGRNQFQKRYLTAHERAAIMGYPESYLDCVDSLFGILTEVLMRNRQIYGHWEEFLDEKYHHFSGNYHGYRDAYQICLGPPLPSDTTVPSTFLKMVPRGVRFTGEFFTAEEYKKRLVGHAFSVPVVEYLLSPVKHLFADERHDLYAYEYAWADQQRESNVAGAVPAEDDVSQLAGPEEDSAVGGFVGDAAKMNPMLADEDDLKVAAIEDHSVDGNVEGDLVRSANPVVDNPSPDTVTPKPDPNVSSSSVIVAGNLPPKHEALPPVVLKEETLEPPPPLPPPQKRRRWEPRGLEFFETEV